MIPEIDNEHKIKFEWDKFNPDNAKMETDSDGYIIRKSHSNYVGTQVKLPNDKYGYTHVKMFMPPKCYVKVSKLHEHGVFAAKNFVPGEVIEEVKILLLDSTTNTCKDWVLNRYALELPCDCDICKLNGKTLFIPSGNGLLYNHSDMPNAFYYVEKPFKRMKIIALTEIEKDQEILWYYGKDVEKKFKDIVKYYPRPDVPENLPAIIPEFVTSKPCTSCGQSQNEIQFRSMIVPERIVE